ncbi:hypothetical protein EWM64_g10554 [Hericium alpestre]|uniref:Uncharacterized protein n=1 Tax=Hericium alpestre TaxID=135208 RepID=A0A4Y9ZI91_9AGAM|nr:hypothetical protein EWM64_g10554 [Hericium alpestre]
MSPPFAGSQSPPLTVSQSPPLAGSLSPYERDHTLFLPLDEKEDLEDQLDALRLKRRERRRVLLGPVVLCFTVLPTQSCHHLTVAIGFPDAKAEADTHAARGGAEPQDAYTHQHEPAIACDREPEAPIAVVQVVLTRLLHPTSDLPVPPVNADLVGLVGLDARQHGHRHHIDACNVS